VTSTIRLDYYSGLYKYQTIFTQNDIQIYLVGTEESVDFISPISICLYQAFMFIVSTNEIKLAKITLANILIKRRFSKLMEIEQDDLTNILHGEY